MNHRSTRRGLRALGIVTATTALAATALTGCSVTGATGKGGKEGSGSGTVNALFMKQAGWTEDEYKSEIKKFEKANPKINVKPTFVSYESLHDKIVTSAPAGTYDVVDVDVIWSAEFASKNLLADMSSRIPDSWKKDMFPGVLNTAKYKGKYYGVPSGPSTKMLFYNTKMLKQVGATSKDLNTWDGVLKTAKKIKKAGLTKYPLSWSWGQAEALICDYAQLLGAFGGQFTDKSGKLVINNKAGVRTLTWMKKTIDDGLTNHSSTTFLEDDVNKAMAQGDTAIGLNWESTLRDLRDPKISKISKNAAVLPTPEGPSGKRPGVNGAMAYSIPSGSKNQDAAWKLIKYFSSQKVQEAHVSSSLPDWTSSYDKASVKKTNPDVVKAAKTAYASSIRRPTVTNYSSTSQILQVEIQNALLGKKSPQKALDDGVKQANANQE